MEQEIRQHMEQIQKSYHDMHLDKMCNEIIEEILPDLYHIREKKAQVHGRPVIQYITSRVKTPESITCKLIRKKRKVTMEKALETINDLAGIRVVCSFQDDVYRVKKAVEKLYNIQVEKVKDYIAHPKSSGYRSIHMIVKVKSCDEQSEKRKSEFFPVRLEIQICSAAMNYWAMLEHQLSYKNSRIGEAEYDKIQEKLKSYAVQIADIDKKFLQVRKKIEKL